MAIDAVPVNQLRDDSQRAVITALPCRRIVGLTDDRD
jgi:hypothetical protein